MTKVILIGAGGHSKVIQDIAAASNEFDLYAIVDDAFEETKVRNGIIYAHTDFLHEITTEEYGFCIAIGNNAVRKKLFEELSIPLEQYLVFIHPSAVISQSAGIGYGTVIMPHAVVNADTVIGNHCILNTHAIVEHDNQLADYVHISPNATLCGTVKVGEGAHICAGAVVIPGKKIGRWSIIGAGSVVIKDTSDHVTLAGVPAKEFE